MLKENERRCTGILGFFRDYNNENTLTIYSFEDEKYDFEIFELESKKVNTLSVDKDELRKIRDSLNYILENF